MAKEHRDVRPQAFKESFQASSGSGECAAQYLGLGLGTVLVESLVTMVWSLGSHGGNSKVI